MKRFVIMKSNRIVTSFMLAASLAFTLSSCSKEVITPQDDAGAALASKVQTLTTEYQSQHVPTSDKGGKWRRIIAADLNGVATVGVSCIPLFLGGPLAQGIGIGITICGGAGASINAAEAEANGNGNANSNGGGVIIETRPVSNLSNPYEQAGVLHYRVVDEYFNTSRTDLNPNSMNLNAYIDMAFQVLVSAGIASPADRAYYTESLIGSGVSANGGNSIIDISNLSGLSNSDRTILNNYHGAVMGANDYYSFANYSISVENAVLSSSIPLQSKIILLMDMSTARHGVHYWMNRP